MPSRVPDGCDRFPAVPIAAAPATAANVLASTANTRAIVANAHVTVVVGMATAADVVASVPVDAMDDIKAFFESNRIFRYCTEGD